MLLPCPKENTSNVHYNILPPVKASLRAKPLSRIPDMDTANRHLGRQTWKKEKKGVLIGLT